MLRRNIWPMVIALASYIALALLIPRTRPFAPPLDIIVATVLFMAVQILLIRYICALQMSFAVSGSIFLVSLAVFLTLLKIGLSTKGGAPWISLPLDISRIAAAATLGYLVSFVLRDKNIVLPIAGFAAYFDVWTVNWGPTKHFIATAPKIVYAVSAPVFAPGGHGTPLAFIGPADLVFLAVFFGAIYRHKMEPSRTFWFLVPLLSGAMLLVTLGNYAGLPALVPMSVGVIGANAGHVKFDKQEKWSVVIVSLILVLALAAFLLHKAAH